MQADPACTPCVLSVQNARAARAREAMRIQNWDIACISRGMKLGGHLARLSVDHHIFDLLRFRPGGRDRRICQWADFLEQRVGRDWWCLAQDRHGWRQAATDAAGCQQKYLFKKYTQVLIHVHMCNTHGHVYIHIYI